MGDEWLSETKVFFVVNHKYSGGQNMRKRESDEWLSETKELFQLTPPTLLQLLIRNNVQQKVI